jgi:DnaK suppressor protein
MGKRAKRARHFKAKGRASLADILGAARANGKAPAKWAEHQDRLRRLRERFAGNKSTRTESAKEEPSSFSEHMADAATDSYDRDWALAMLSSEQNALYEIDEALSRIACGIYGTCELTGRPIEPARLKAIPWTRFCAKAQAELEARGAASRTQLGELGG